MIWKIKQRSLNLTAHAQLMGILNVTPDSFSDGGRYGALPAALAHARKLISEGAAIIDIGGESARPGASPVSAEEEIARTLPVIRALRAEWDGYLSIDTMKAPVAAAALDAGADIVNDVSGLTADPEMATVCAKSSCGIVIMHMQGKPSNMQQNPTYSDVCREIRGFFEKRLAELGAIGISPDRICFDPGIGFGKNREHNLSLLRNLDQLSPASRPLLLGISRKSFLSQISENPDPAGRDAATIAITALTRRTGVMLHRVHAVGQNLQALRATEALLGISDLK